MLRPKKPTEPKPWVEKPSVLVCYEKHGNCYFNILDDETLFAVALSILKGRDKLGYWYLGPNDIKQPEPPDFDEASIAQMPISMQSDAKAKLRAYSSSKREYDDAMSEHTQIKQAIADQDGAKAWGILRSRKKFEYERCELERYSTEYYE